MSAVRYVIFVIDREPGGDAGTANDAGSAGGAGTARGAGTADGGEMAAIDAFNDRLRDGGHWVLAAGIGGPSTATLIDRRAGSAAGGFGGAGGTSAGAARGAGAGGAAAAVRASLQDGPDAYSGFWIIEASTPEIARALAEAGSAACNRRVELRPFLR